MNYIMIHFDAIHISLNCILSVFAVGDSDGLSTPSGSVNGVPKKRTSFVESNKNNVKCHVILS